VSENRYYISEHDSYAARTEGTFTKVTENWDPDFCFKPMGHGSSPCTADECPDQLSPTGWPLYETQFGGAQGLDPANLVRAQDTAKAYRTFAKDFVSAMQHAHLTISGEARWNEAFASLEVDDEFKTWHPNFLEQFNATAADESATIRTRIWRVPGMGAIASGDASYRKGGPAGTGSPHPTGHDNIEFRNNDFLLKGSIPIYDAAVMAYERMENQTVQTSKVRVGPLAGVTATTALEGSRIANRQDPPVKVVFHPYITLGANPKTYQARKLSESAAGATQGVVQDMSLADSNFASLGGPRRIADLINCVQEDYAAGTVGADVPYANNLMDFAAKMYMDWLYWRAYYMEQEENQFDEIDWGAIRAGVDPNEEIARRDAERNANAERAAVRRDIAAGIVQKAGFKEQCFLLSKIFPLVAYKKDQLDAEVGKRLPYLQSNEFYNNTNPSENPCVQLDSVLHGNACLQVDGSSFGFMNLMTTDPKMFPLFQAQHSQLSMLQPMMRFFKVTEKTVEGHDETTEQEINFDAYERNFPQIFSPQQMLMSATQRGLGAGVKSFNFTYDGSNPFAVKKSIKAKLVIFANSFDELMRCRGDCKSSDSSKGYRYIDLALKTGGPRLGNTAPEGYRRGSEEAGEDPLACIQEAPTSQQTSEGPSPTPENDELAKLNFRLKAVIGYAPPPMLADEEFWSIENRGNRVGNLADAFRGQASTEYNNIRSAVNSSFVTLNLTPTVHDFKFDEQGRVTFTINYLAYVEDFFDQRHFNIFTDLDVAKYMFSRRLRFEKLKKACNNEEMNKLKEQEKEEISRNKVESLQALNKRLFKTGRVHYLNITYEQLRDWQSNGPYANIGDISPVTGQRTLDVSEAYDAAARIEQDATQQLSEDSNSTARSSQLFSKYVNDVNEQNIPYFYVADLVDTILEGIDSYLGENGMSAFITDLDPEEEGGLSGPGMEFITECDKQYEIYKLKKFAEAYRRFRTVLGPVEIVNPINVSQSQFVNFGDLPIAIKYFNEWLTAKLLKKDRAVYTLTRFLNDFLNHQKVRMNQATVTDYTSQVAYESMMETKGAMTAIDTLTYHTMKTNLARKSAGSDALYAPLRLVPLSAGNSAQGGGYGSEGELVPPILNISGPQGSDPRNVASTTGDDGGIQRETNYMIYYAGRTKPTELMTGHIATDVKNGIMHYNHGQDVGMVKTVNLNKTESPGLAEVRFEQDGYDGLSQLRVLYDATITTFCLPSVFPGQYLYIDPRSFSPSEGASYGEKFDLTQFGVGGYFMAHKVETRLGVGEAETTIHAKWVAEVNKETDESQGNFTDDTDSPSGQEGDIRDPTTIGKCQQSRQERQHRARLGSQHDRAEATTEAARDQISQNPTGGS
jgi:hypothetical protein